MKILRPINGKGCGRAAGLPPGCGLYFFVLLLALFPPTAPTAFPGEIGAVEARYYQRLEDRAVRCGLCYRECVIPEGVRGFCRVRENREGKLYSLVYGRVYSWQVAPIEKDGMYHLLPGAPLLALATASCNFRCRHCHNWSLTQSGPEEISYRRYSPEAVVDQALGREARAISGTINEPTIFYEYLYDIARIARERGLKFQFHTNGYISPEPLRALLQHTDGVVVDLKGFTEVFYREVAAAELKPVLKTLKIIREEGVWLEITNLVIPTLNDDLEDIGRMCAWIAENLGYDVPLHFTRFSPSYRLTRLPSTPVGTLEAARRIAREAGLRYVTIGNVPGHKYNSTFCPGCGKRLIHRVHFSVLENNIESGECGFCGYEVAGVWK